MINHLKNKIRELLELEKTPGGNLPGVVTVFQHDYTTLPANGFPAVAVFSVNDKTEGNSGKICCEFYFWINVYSIRPTREEAEGEVSEIVLSISKKGIIPALWKSRFIKIGDITFLLQKVESAPFRGEHSGQVVYGKTVEAVYNTWFESQ